MSRPHLPHRVIRTRNKHSRAVLRDDTIVIRLARNLSRTEEREHIQELLRRMTRIVLEERQKVVVDPFRPLLRGQQQTLTVRLATGKTYRFSLHPGDRSSVRRTRNGWSITVGPRVREAGLHRACWALLSASERKRITHLVQRINAATYRVRIRGIRLQVAESQWGSCSAQGVIMVNSALLFLPPRLLRYIIIHELAHCIRPDHSAAFWRLVERAMPGWRSARDALNGYRLPSLHRRPG